MCYLPSFQISGRCCRDQTIKNHESCLLQTGHRLALVSMMFNAQQLTRQIVGGGWQAADQHPVISRVFT
ncbi:unnamed protein product [Musa acuminata subsp. malaccensis]|uniref:(wild Malaysian banana) hypothetical protein n=1 Tax=Musa acuminata subsp. malaccensis TaxID=214687 RepID=A0A804HQA2_MUSAM|nr:unnamed protein product [Musa acuminata subsp. malaccensis]